MRIAAARRLPPKKGRRFSPLTRCADYTLVINIFPGRTGLEFPFFHISNLFVPTVVNKQNMSEINPEHILPLVEKPSRYIGGEINSVKKSGGGIRLRMALAFPDTYEIGTSHFGMQILYHLINARRDMAAERVFAPGKDMADLLKSSGTPLFSLETRRPLASFDIIGFSLLYELNYTNVLMMLDLGGIAFYARDRDENSPLIIAGGPCTVNPEPMAPFFDAMVVGDGEPVVPEMARAWMNWKEGGGEKTELLKAWARIEGVYVPSFFEAGRDESGRPECTPMLPGYASVCRAVAPDLDEAPFPDRPVIPFGRPVHDRLRLEIARGCTRGCRFCQAGMIYRPVRERSLSRLLSLAETGLEATGYEDLSLLSLSTGDYSCLLPLMRHLTDRYAHRRLALSIPSFRAGTLSPEMMEQVRRIRKTGFTIAPEAGSERLRAVINKNIGEAEIVDTVSAAFELGWQVIKLYFMIGLPTETDDDLSAIVDMVRRLQKIRVRGRRGGNINVSAACFIPKPHVPFQWAGQLPQEACWEKLQTLRSRLSGVRGVNFKWQDPGTSRLEGIFARGDRRLAPVLVAAYNRGCRFDAWSDSFDENAWIDAFSSQGVDPDDYLGPVSMADRLAWDHIQTGVSRDYLIGEYQKALGADSTPDCRDGVCQGCGVCDFEKRMPRIASREETAPPATAAFWRSGSEPVAVAGRRFRVAYSKTGPARFFGHLELANILVRALHRAGIRLVYTAGFHPKPKIAFGDALAVGVESMEEYFCMTVAREFDGERIRQAVNRQLPRGLEITACIPAAGKETPLSPQAVSYRITLPEGRRFDDAAYKRFLEAGSFEVAAGTRKNPEKRIDLKSVVARLHRLGPECLFLRLRRIPGAAVRPDRVIAQVFALPEVVVRCARILKLPESEPVESAQRLGLSRMEKRGIHG